MAKHPYGTAHPVHGEQGWVLAPLVRVTYDRGSQLVVEADDNETVAVFSFESFQAVRVTTIDAFPVPGLLPRARLSVFPESLWLRELRATLAAHDPDADFLDDTNHYVLVGYDDVVEVIAPGFLVEEADPSPVTPVDRQPTATE
jgi:hypothetical protein